MPTTTTAPQGLALSLDAFSLEAGGSHGRPLHFSTDRDDVESEAPDRLTGVILVRIGVDFECDTVALDDEHSSQLDLLDTAIADLQQVRDTLAAVTPSAARGRCMQGTDWGRCKLEHHHQGTCEGPTQAEHEAQLAARASFRSRVARSA